MYQYQVSFGDAIKRAFSSYCCFTGRASRSEYWWFVLFCTIVAFVLGFFGGFFAAKDAMNGESSGLSIFSIINWLWSLAILLPSWGLLWRRLHDTGRSGWNVCWCFLPLIGAIILIVYCCQESQPMENKYGPVPNLTQA